MLLVVFAALAGLSLPTAILAQSALQQAVPVRTGIVGRQDLPIYARGLGTVQAWQSVTVRAQVSGYVTQLNFRDGQEVHRGDLLAMIDPRPYAALLAQAQAKRAADEALLTNSQLNARRSASLAQSQYGSRQQADNDIALVRQGQANRLGDDAAIAQAQLNLDFCRITAPIDGVAGFRLLDVGNLIQNAAQTAILTIQQVHPIAVVFTLAQSDFPAVQAAREEAGGEALPAVAFSADERTTLGEGELVAPNNSIDASTGTIALKAVFANRDSRLWPGQYVNIHLRLRVQHNVVVVPLEAVQHGPDGLYVYAVTPRDTARSQPITAGYQDDRLAAVTSGLAGGETIVLDGQSRLQDGSRIAVGPDKDGDKDGDKS